MSTTGTSALHACGGGFLAGAIIDAVPVNIPYAVGALAVAVHAEPRFTRDADLAVSVANDAEAEALVRRLQDSGYRATASVEQDAVHRLATVRLLPPEQDPAGPGIVIDLLFASSGIEREIVRAARPLELMSGAIWISF